MLRCWITLMLTLSMLPTFAAEDPDIRKLMTAQEFAESGLSRLSNEEFDAINRWLIRYTAQDATEMISSSLAVKAANSGPIRSRIDGQFSGWNGQTQFLLKNGQLWETNTTRRYEYSAIDPEVEFTKNWMGIYRMRVVDTDKSINVRRIR